MNKILSITSIFALVTAPVVAQCESTSTSIGSDIVDTAVAAGSFKTLTAALGAAGLVETLRGKGPFTVFAPTDAAFAALPKGTVAKLLKKKNRAMLTSILTYHVVGGSMPAKKVVKQSGVVTVNGQRASIASDKSGARIAGAKIIEADIKCSNGVIHVIDTVIMPQSGNIVDVAVGAGSFKTLAKAVQAAGLIETLQGPGPFTVFAPTDEAFARLPKGTVAELLKPENKKRLAKILTYHVVSGRKFAADVVGRKHVRTVEGSKARIEVKKGAARIAGARITATDINASNGVIHVIDRVILPPMQKSQ